MQRKNKSQDHRKRRLRFKSELVRKLSMESLERRELMAADLVFPTDQNNLLGDDLTLSAQQNGGNLSVRLLRTSDMTQVVMVPMDDSGDVTINVRREETTAGDIDPFADTLRIDLNSLNLLNTFVVGNGGVLTLNFEGGVEVPSVSEDHLFVAASGTANVGFGLSVITTADVTLNAVTANFSGNLLLRSNPINDASGSAFDPDKVLAFPAASITINGGSITATNINIEAKASKTIVITPETLFDDAISFAEVIVDSSASVSVLGSAIINATGDLTVLADSNMTTNAGRAPSDDGNASDDDTAEDAAIVVSVIDNVTNLSVTAGSSLSATGMINLVSNNVVSATSFANGLAGSSSAGGTVAVTTITGDTNLIVDGGASVAAGGNVSLISNSLKTAITTAVATLNGVTNDNNNTTTT
ncbi:MAG: hypothetical protein ABL921_09760, partial [Pirellula sp.]